MSALDKVGRALVKYDVCFPPILAYGASGPNLTFGHLIAFNRFFEKDDISLWAAIHFIS